MFMKLQNAEKRNQNKQKKMNLFYKKYHDETINEMLINLENVWNGRNMDEF